ncbi:unnamed protein product [Hymenolepis diminuta]|uniref:Spermatogenesis associated 6 n=1 Tax=Hymenolepis diminuta TaxID=6216 RepID=A0A0R3SIJ9_HYMDI|nr:unnamed protein product [Hymenolepis diminuta]
MEEEEECFVFPAITKPYSQVTPASSPHKDRADSFTTPHIIGNPTSRPLYRPNDRKRESGSQSPMPGSSDPGRRFLRLPHPSSSEDIVPKRGLLKKSSFKTKMDSTSEIRRSIITIQDVRKYSVVDPATLKFVQGKHPHLNISYFFLFSKFYDCILSRPPFQFTFYGI